MEEMSARSQTRAHRPVHVTSMCFTLRKARWQRSPSHDVALSSWPEQGPLSSPSASKPKSFMSA